MLRIVVLFVALTTVLAFTSNVRSSISSVTSFATARSKSVPFAEQPAALTGQYPGDVGFDPLGLSNIWADVRLLLSSRLSPRNSSFREIGGN